MKKLLLTLISTTFFITGCSNSNQKTNSSTSSETTSTKNVKDLKGDAYESFSNSVKNVKDSNSFSAAVNSTYTMSYSDDTKDIFEFDGVLEKEVTDDETKAHVTQNIESNGGTFNLEGYYYKGKLYNTYNDVNYYEEMEYSDLEKTMLVPLHSYAYTQDSIESIKAQEDEDGNIIYTIQLKNDSAADLFSDRFDTYGLNNYDNYQVISNEIVDTFDSEGHFVSETTTFETSVTSSDQTVGVTFTSSLNYLKIDSTEVTISDELKKEQKEYVYYEDIDTSSISSDSQYDDTEEDTTTATFKKRLVNRLGYEIDDSGAYTQSYNDNESYTINFDNDTFTYTRYSISYTYNWKGNVGTMGSCTVNYDQDKQSSSCEDSTVEMMKTVEQYFEMELYYCGLSLSDLRSEIQ